MKYLKLKQQYQMRQSGGDFHLAQLIDNGKKLLKIVKEGKQAEHITEIRTLLTNISGQIGDLQKELHTDKLNPIKQNIDKMLLLLSSEHPNSVVLEQLEGIAKQLENAKSLIPNISAVLSERQYITSLQQAQQHAHQKAQQLAQLAQHAKQAVATGDTSEVSGSLLELSEDLHSAGKKIKDFGQQVQDVSKKFQVVMKPGLVPTQQAGTIENIKNLSKQVTNDTSTASISGFSEPLPY